MSDHCKHCLTALEAPTRRQLMTGAAALVAASALSIGRAKTETDAIVTPQNVIAPSEALGARLSRLAGTYGLKPEPPASQARLENGDI